MRFCCCHIFSQGASNWPYKTPPQTQHWSLILTMQPLAKRNPSMRRSTTWRSCQRCGESQQQMITPGCLELGGQVHLSLPLAGAQLRLKMNLFLSSLQVVLVVKNPPANAGDLRDAGSIPGWGKSSGGGHGNPLHYSCQENPMDREEPGRLQSTALQRVRQDWTNLAHMHVRPTPSFHYVKKRALSTGSI